MQTTRALWMVLTIAAPMPALAAESVNNITAADLGWLECMGALAVLAAVVAIGPLRGGLIAAWKAYGPGAASPSDDHAPSGH